MASLHDAARNGDLDALAKAIAVEKVDARDKTSRTALHMAAWAGHMDCVKLLHSHGERTRVKGERVMEGERDGCGCCTAVARASEERGACSCVVS